MGNIHATIRMTHQNLISKDSLPKSPNNHYNYDIKFTIFINKTKNISIMITKVDA